MVSLRRWLRLEGLSPSKQVKHGAYNSNFRQRDAEPAPLSIVPSQGWHGNDGPWSTFLLGIGTPPQYSYVLISTAAVQPWVVLPGGCTPEDPINCPQSRGRLFRPNASSTWQDQGLFTLQFEQNLGIYEYGDFGLDTITLGMPGSAAPSLTRQILAGIATKKFYIPTWGIRPAATNLTDLNDHITDLVSNLKAERIIPSLSWGYTAGAYYQNQINKQGVGSLTFGGYDASRFVPNNITFPFAADTSRDLVVGLYSITTGETPTSLLPTPILSFIDAGVPHIWLPLEACHAFEKAFNLTWNSALDLYLVTDTAHEALMSRNASLEFSIGSSLTNPTKSAVTINLPYSAFDLQLTTDYPGVTNITRYFPLRRAANTTQYTLGRAFLQQAYLIADYERSTFSVHQTIFPDSPTQDLRVIPPASATTPSTSLIPVPSPQPSHKFSPGTMAGIIIAVVIVLLTLLSGLYYLYRHKCKPSQRASSPEFSPFGLKPELPATETAAVSELHGEKYPTPELASWQVDRRRPELECRESRRELWGTAVEHELDTRPPCSIYEMPAR